MTRILYQIRNKITELEYEVNNLHSELVISYNEKYDIDFVIRQLKCVITDMEHD